MRMPTELKTTDKVGMDSRNKKSYISLYHCTMEIIPLGKIHNNNNITSYSIFQLNGPPDLEKVTSGVSAAHGKFWTMRKFAD